MNGLAILMRSLHHAGNEKPSIESRDVLSGPVRFQPILPLSRRALMVFGIGHLAVVFGKLGASPSLSSSPNFFLDAPWATWIGAGSVAEPTFDLEVDEDVVAGYKIWGESSLDNFATVLETVSSAISGDDIASRQIESFAFAPFSDGLTYVRFWVSDSADKQISPKSNIISETIFTASADAAQFLLLEAS